MQVLVKRLEYLLRSGVDPKSILAITFTRKASGEMRERLERLVDKKKAKFLTIGTFHAVCGSALRRCGSLAHIQAPAALSWHCSMFHVLEVHVDAHTRNIYVGTCAQPGCGIPNYQLPSVPAF